MREYFQRLGKWLKPYHVVHAMYLFIAIAGIIYRLLKQS
jgi:hypothetical protein